MEQFASYSGLGLEKVPASVKMLRECGTRLFCCLKFLRTEQMMSISVDTTPSGSLLLWCKMCLHRLPFLAIIFFVTQALLSRGATLSLDMSPGHGSIHLGCHPIRPGSSRMGCAHFLLGASSWRSSWSPWWWAVRRGKWWQSQGLLPPMLLLSIACPCYLLAYVHQERSHGMQEYCASDVFLTPEMSDSWNFISKIKTL